MSVDDPLAMILCDYCEVVNGKLYLMGGGIAQVLVVGSNPINLAVGIVFQVPWQETNREQKMQFGLLTEDGQALPGPDGTPFGIEGAVEVGRPPGVKIGSPIPVPLAIRLPPMMLPPGGYRFEMRLNGSLEGVLPFTVKHQKGMT